MARCSGGRCWRPGQQGPGSPYGSGKGTGRQANAGLIAARGQVARPNPGVIIPGIGVQPMPPAPAPVPVKPAAPVAPPPVPQVPPQPAPVDEWAAHRGRPLPTPPTTGLLNPLAQLGMEGPGFTQRNIQIPQPNTWEAFQYGTPGHVQQFPRFAPEQEAAMRSLLGGGLQGLSQTDLSFEPIAERARKQFREETIPGLAERFTALGGGQRSSAFGQQLGRAGSDLESQLAALGSQYNLQKFGALTNLSRLGLEPAYETTYFPAQPGAYQMFAQGAAQGIPAATELAGRAIGGAASSLWNWATGAGAGALGGAAAANAVTPTAAQGAAQALAPAVSQQAAQAATAGGFGGFMSSIWPTLVGAGAASGALLGTFPLLPAVVFAGLGLIAAGGLARATS